MDNHRHLLVTGGICAILWPVLSLSFFAAYPIAAGGAMLPLQGGVEAYATRLAQLGTRPAVVALEWSQVALPLLILPMLLALYRSLEQRGQGNLMLAAIGMGFLGVAFMMLSNSFNPTLSHTLGQSYAQTQEGGGKVAILEVLRALLLWRRGLNQIASLLYQGCVAITSIALISGRLWRAWGWAGLTGALLALVAKLSPGLEGISAITWTGLGYCIWPIAMGIGLLGLARKESAPST